MFKLVVLCTFAALATAEPGALIQPLAQFSTIITPGKTSISQHASSVVHPSPALYSPAVLYSHFIKKRSAPLTVITPNTYYTRPLLATTYSAPLIHTSPILPAVAPVPLIAQHLIKKRSVLPAAYYAPTTYAAITPQLATTYTAPIVHSAPLISTAPLAYQAHFIKKRSAPLLSTYLAPTSYSTQSRIDLQHTPAVATYAAPYLIPNSYAFTHL